MQRYTLNFMASLMKGEEPIEAGFCRGFTLSVKPVYYQLSIPFFQALMQNIEAGRRQIWYLSLLMDQFGR